MSMPWRVGLPAANVPTRVPSAGQRQLTLPTTVLAAGADVAGAATGSGGGVAGAGTAGAGGVGARVATAPSTDSNGAGTGTVARGSTRDGFAATVAGAGRVAGAD